MSETTSEQPLERQETESSVDYLLRMEEKGYLFHGSGDPTPIEKLEPRKASDPNTSWNSETAVYASGKAMWSTIFAVYKGKHSWATDTRLTDKGEFEVTASINPKYKNDIKNWRGFVYILPSIGFEKDPAGIQYRSKNEVVPVAKVEVGIEDFYAMGGRISWEEVNLV